MPPTSQQPTNFKVDVNRAKTQRWAEAKKASYGGDDWGGYDEYDEYDDYEEPPPPPKQTGLRQRGQASKSSIDYQPAPGPLSSESRPQVQGSQPFEKGDDRRGGPNEDNPSFGSQGPHRPTQVPATHEPSDQQSRWPPYDQRTPSSTRPHELDPYQRNLSPQQNPNTAGAGRPSGHVPPVQTTNLGHGQNPGQGRYYSRNTSAASSTPSSGGDRYNRRDFSPSAVPQPLTTRPSPSQEFHPPARKDSLETSTRPPVAPARQDSSQMSLAQTQNPPTTSSPPPMQTAPPIFVRPSDIYKRMGEEREKERQSMESGRPSMDAIDRAAGTSSRGPQPARSSQEQNRGDENAARLKPALNPVAERQSEYGMDGFAVSDPVLARAIGAKVTPGQSNLLSEPPPSLPQLGRFSGFGMDLGFGDGTATAANERNTQSGESDGAAQVNDEQKPPQGQQQNPDLQHQPSLGFRSAVNQAFDGHDERATASVDSVNDSQRSNQGSEVSRSNTDSTGNISPIMSRVPSGKTAVTRALERNDRIANTPPITEEEHGPSLPESRPNSTGTLKGMTQQQGDSSAGAERVRTTSGTSSLTPVSSRYSRDFTVPDTSTVPSKLPAISTRKPVELSNEGEIDMATPLKQSYEASESMTPKAVEAPQYGDDASVARDYSTRESDLVSAANMPGESNPGRLGIDEDTAQTSFLQTHTHTQSSAMGGSRDAPAELPAARPISPPKSRVREIATKYNELHDRPSPTGSVSSWTSSPIRSASPGKEDTDLVRTESPGGLEREHTDSRPQRSRQEAAADPVILPRPSLPGEWVSYAGSVASTGTNVPPATSSRDEQDQDTVGTSGVAESAGDQRSLQATPDFSPSRSTQPMAGGTYNKSNESPMAALAAAGTALAENLKHTVGMADDEASSTSATDDSGMAEEDDVRATNATQKQLTQSALPTSNSSDAAPTPPLKDDKFDPTNAMRSGSDYYSTTAPLRGADSHNHRTGEQEQRLPAATYEGRTSATEPNTDIDRLHQEIERNLTPSTSTFPTNDTNEPRENSATNQEYSSFWTRDSSTSGSFNRGSYASSGHVAESSDTPKQAVPQQPVQRTSKMESPTLGQGAASQSHFLDNRFSWEDSQDLPSDLTGPQFTETRESEEFTGAPTRSSMDQAPTLKTSPHSLSAPDAYRAENDRQAQQMRDAPTPTAELESSAGPPSPPSPPMKPVGTGSNAPVELPTADSSNHQHTGLRRPSEPLSAVDSSTTQRLRASSLAGQKSNQANIPGVRQILAIKQPGDRIIAYQSAREQYGSMETGLNDWLSYMVQTYPEHSHVPSGVPRPVVNTSGLAETVRSRVPPSISKLTQNVTGANSQSPGGQAGAPMSPDRSGSVSQSKRQELLHTAGVFGGKASQGAKGLFAKSKSRFRGASSEKAQTSSSSASPAEPRGMLTSFRRRSRQLSSTSPQSVSPSHVRPSTASSPSARAVIDSRLDLAASDGPKPDLNPVSAGHRSPTSSGPPQNNVHHDAPYSRDPASSRDSYFPEVPPKDDGYQPKQPHDGSAYASLSTKRLADELAESQSAIGHNQTYAGFPDRDAMRYRGAAQQPAVDPFMDAQNRDRYPEPRPFLNYQPVQNDGLEDDDREAKRPQPWISERSANGGTNSANRTNSSSTVSELGGYGARGFGIWEDAAEEPTGRQYLGTGSDEGLQAAVREDREILMQAAADQDRDAYAPMGIENSDVPTGDKSEVSVEGNDRKISRQAIGLQTDDAATDIQAQEPRAMSATPPGSRDVLLSASVGQPPNPKDGWPGEKATIEHTPQQGNLMQDREAYAPSFASRSRKGSTQSFVSAMSMVHHPAAVGQESATSATTKPSTMSTSQGGPGFEMTRPVQAPIRPVTKLQRPEPSQVFPDLYLDPRQQDTEYQIPGVGPPSRSPKTKSWFPFKRASQPPSPVAGRSRSNSIGDMLAAATARPRRTDPRVSSQRPVSMDSSQLLSRVHTSSLKNQTRNPSTDLLSQYSQETAEILNASERKTRDRRSRFRSRSRSRVRDVLRGKSRTREESRSRDDLPRAVTEPITPNDQTRKKRRSSFIGTLFRRADTLQDDETPLPGSTGKPAKLAKSSTRASVVRTSGPRDDYDATLPQSRHSNHDDIPRVPRLPDLRDLGNDLEGTSQSPQRYPSKNSAGDDSFAWRPRGNTTSSYEGVPSYPPVESPATPGIPLKVEDPRRAAHVAYLQNSRIFPARKSSMYSPIAREMSARNRHSMYEYQSPSPVLPDEDSYFDLPQNQRYYAAKAQAFSPGPGGTTPQPSETPKKSLLSGEDSANGSGGTNSPAAPGTNPLRQHPTAATLDPPAFPTPPPPPRSPSRPVSRGGLPTLAIPQQQQHRQNSQSPSPANSSPAKPSPVTASSVYTNRPSISSDVPMSSMPASRDSPNVVPGSRQRESSISRQRESSLPRQREDSITRQREHPITRQRETSIPRQREQSLPRQRDRSLLRHRDRSSSRPRDVSLPRQTEAPINPVPVPVPRSRNTSATRPTSSSNRDSATFPTSTSNRNSGNFTTQEARGVAAGLPDSGIRARMAARDAEWEAMTSAVSAASVERSRERERVRERSRSRAASADAGRRSSSLPVHGGVDGGGGGVQFSGGIVGEDQDADARRSRYGSRITPAAAAVYDAQTQRYASQIPAPAHVSGEVWSAHDSMPSSFNNVPSHINTFTPTSITQSTTTSSAQMPQRPPPRPPVQERPSVPGSGSSGVVRTPSMSDVNVRPPNNTAVRRASVEPVRPHSATMSTEAASATCAQNPPPKTSMPPINSAATVTPSNPRQNTQPHPTSEPTPNPMGGTDPYGLRAGTAGRGWRVATPRTTSRNRSRDGDGEDVDAAAAKRGAEEDLGLSPISGGPGWEWRPDYDA